MTARNDKLRPSAVTWGAKNWAVLSAILTIAACGAPEAVRDEQAQITADDALSRVSALEARLDQMESRIADLESQISEAEYQNSSLKGRVSSLEVERDALRSKISYLEYR